VKFDLGVTSIFRPYWVSVFPGARYGGLVDDHGFCPRLKNCAYWQYLWLHPLSLTILSHSVTYTAFNRSVLPRLI